MGNRVRKWTYDDVLHPRSKYSALDISGMDKITVPSDVQEMLERQSLEIFTQVVNSGRTFQEALASILTTGMHWGDACRKEQRPTKGESDG